MSDVLQIIKDIKSLDDIEALNLIGTTVQEQRVTLTKTQIKEGDFVKVAFRNRGDHYGIVTKMLKKNVDVRLIGDNPPKGSRQWRVGPGLLTPVPVTMQGSLKEVLAALDDEVFTLIPEVN